MRTAPLSAGSHRMSPVVIAAFLILIAGAVICFHINFLPGLLSAKIENELNNRLDASSGEYLEYRVGGVKAGIFFNKISIEKISLNKYLAGNEIVDPALKYMEISIFNAELTAHSSLLLLSGKKNLNISKLQADSLSVVVHNFQSLLNTGVLSTETMIKTSYNPDLAVDKIVSWQSGSSLPADTSRLQIHSGHVRFEGKIEFPRNVNEIFENVVLKEHSFQISNASFSLPGGLYRFHTDTVSFIGEEGKISISGLQMLSRYPREEFYKHVSYETDRFGFDLKSIEVNGFRTFRVKDKRIFAFSLIDVTGGVIDVFRDRRPPFNEQQRPGMPVRLISTAPFGLHAAVINLSEIDILYSEYPENPVSADFSESTGEVPFKKLTATIRNITNLADSLEKDSIMHIKAEASIFDKAVLAAEFNYNLGDLYGSYNASGKLNELPFRSINRALYPLTGVKVADGLHRSSEFTFSGNDIESEGELYMYWSDLSLELTPGEGEIISAITRTLGELLYHPSNPDNTDSSPSGKIEFERDTARFVFNYWWKCYLSGIKNSVLRDFVPL